MPESRKISRITALNINEINWQLSQLSNRLDELEGWRGTPTFRSDLDIKNNKIRSMADAVLGDDSMAFSQLASSITNYAGDTVVVETSFGLSSTPGTQDDYSRKDHTHGSPTNPITAHLAASDPHTQYEIRFTVVSHNVDTVLILTDLRKIHVMDVAGGDRYFILPDIGAGDVGKWIVLVRIGTGNSLKIFAGGMDTILNSSAGGYIECTDALHDYSTLELIVIADGQWGSKSYGIWSTY